jgi:PAS domain S-box-containing protein
MITPKNDELYKLIADNFTDVIYTIGLDEKINFVSPSVEVLFGYKPQEVVGKSVKNFLTPESYRRQNEGMQKALLEQDAEVTEKLTLQAIHKNGELIWVEIHAKFLVNDDEKLVGILGIARDVSDRVRSEEEYKKRVDELNRENEQLKNKLRRG